MTAKSFGDAKKPYKQRVKNAVDPEYALLLTPIPHSKHLIHFQSTLKKNTPTVPTWGLLPTGIIFRALQERYDPAISFDNSVLTAIIIYSRIRKLPPSRPYCQIECEYDPPLKVLCSLPLVVNRSFYSEAPVSSHLTMLVDTSTHMLQPCRSNWTPSSPEHQLSRRVPEVHRKLVMSPWVE